VSEEGADERDAASAGEGCRRRLLGTSLFASIGALATGITLPMWIHSFAIAAVIVFLMICGWGNKGEFTLGGALLESLFVFTPAWLVASVFVLPTVVAGCLAALAVVLRSMGFLRVAIVPLMLSVFVGLATLGACAAEGAMMCGPVVVAPLVPKPPEEASPEPKPEPKPAPDPPPSPRRRKGKRR
jgi:hypothetical protein